MFSEK